MREILHLLCISMLLSKPCEDYKCILMSFIAEAIPELPSLKLCKELENLATTTEMYIFSLTENACIKPWKCYNRKLYIPTRDENLQLRIFFATHMVLVYIIAIFLRLLLSDRTFHSLP